MLDSLAFKEGLAPAERNFSRGTTDAKRYGCYLSMYCDMTTLWYQIFVNHSHRRRHKKNKNMRNGMPHIRNKKQQQRKEQETTPSYRESFVAGMQIACAFVTHHTIIRVGHFRVRTQTCSFYLFFCPRCSS